MAPCDECEGNCGDVPHNNELLKDGDNGGYIHLSKGEDEVEQARRLVGSPIPPGLLANEQDYQFLQDFLKKPEEEDTTNPKDILGSKKPDLSLVPSAGIIYEALAMEDGAIKYGPYNWREKKVRARVYVAACMRHLQSWLDGEECAQDSGKPHLAHAKACLGIIIDAKETGNMVDDRPIPGAAAELIAKYTKG